MTLSSLILILLIGGLAALLGEKLGQHIPKWIAALTLLVTALPVYSLLNATPVSALWIAEENHDWIPRFNIHFHLAIDGISLLLIALTLLVGFVAVFSQWKDKLEYQGFFYLNILWTLAGVIGVFIAIDLFLFFVFWEIMLIPMYLLIAIWGGDNRRYAALKFLLFTQAGGLLMLASIVAMVLLNQQSTGLLTFDYTQLAQHAIAGKYVLWIMLGFLVSFAIKLPVVPFHTWQADAYSQAPTAASILLAGILSKMGGYGLVRFVLPLFPEAVNSIAPYAMAIASFTIVYGAVLAFAQQDIKRLIAYASLSHMGFIVLGCFALTTLGLQGAVMQMMAHGISTAGLLFITGMIEQRYNTRDITKLGGIWQVAPKLGAFALFFIVASLGMPGLGNFVAEFLTLAGAFRPYPLLTMIATSTLVFGAAYSLRIAHKTIFGPLNVATVADTDNREGTVMLAMAVLLLLLGLHPQPVIDMAQQTLDHIGSLSMPYHHLTTGVQP